MSVSPAGRIIATDLRHGQKSKQAFPAMKMAGETIAGASARLH
jgi:hypothetical protein